MLNRLASMGPRLFRRGNISTAKCLPQAQAGFNGATSFQTWKLVDPPDESMDTARFNGATSFQTWKQV